MKLLCSEVALCAVKFTFGKLRYKADKNLHTGRQNRVKGAYFGKKGKLRVKTGQKTVERVRKWVKFL